MPAVPLLAATPPAQPARSTAAGTETLKGAFSLFARFPSPRFIAIELLVVLALRVARGRFGAGDAIVALAVVVYWPFQEWVLHKYVLHLRPRKLGRFVLDPLFARKHRSHHRRPWDLGDVFLPIPVLVAATVVTAAFWLVAMPSIEIALSGMASLAAMALLYEWTHYLTHTHYRPRSRFYANIALSHRRHHFKSERYWYGFTFTPVDRLLGTAPDHRSVDTSPTCRTLGVVAPLDDDGDHAR